MRLRIPLIILILVLSACGATTPNVGTGPPSARENPLAGGGKIELVSEGYGFTEGPQWVPKDAMLRFTADNTIFQVGTNDKVTIVRKPSNGANGLALDPEGRMIVAEADTRRVTRTDGDGTVTPIAQRFEGHRLNQPNDVAVRSDGTIYFTDPTFGDAAITAELSFHGIFRIAPDGRLTAERRGALTEAPNGVALSPDERRLYVSDYANSSVWVFDVSGDGSLSKARTFAHADSPDSPDGMAVDVAGNVYVTSTNGVDVFGAGGKLWGAISVPRIPSNCAFGGADGRTLYITAREGLYRVKLAHPGRF